MGRKTVLGSKARQVSRLKSRSEIGGKGSEGALTSIPQLHSLQYATD